MPVKHPDKTGYPLPDPVNPPERLCVVVRVPNSTAHREAFIGAVSELTHAYNWASDSAHTAVDAALVWSDVFWEMMQQFYDNDCEGSMNCCYDVVEHRVTSDGHMEIRINGGDWIPDPNDPRTTGTQLPPPVMDETHTKCDAASNAKQHIMDYVAGESAALQAGGGVTALAIAVAALIVALFFGQLEAIPVIVPLILASIVEVFNLGQAAWDAYFTSDVEDIILCALFCSIGEDGRFNQARFDHFIAELGANLPAGVAKDVLINQLVTSGLIALNNMAAYGNSASADCSACTCEPCNIANWTIIQGTEISRSDSEWVIQSVLVAGSHVIEVKAPNIIDCCTLISVETTIGTTEITTYMACEEEWPGDFPSTDLLHVFSGAPVCCNGVDVHGFSTNEIGTVTLVFEVCT
jgi:hypothetical protein